MSGLALLHRRNGRSIDEPLMRIQAKENVQLHHQHGIRNVWKVEDQNGGFVGSRRYDAWGNVISSLGTIPLYGYTGREPDATGLIYYRARYYDPQVGRIIQRDPIGYAGGDINLYAYVRNNPVGFRDPLGLSAADPVTQNSQQSNSSYYGSAGSSTSGQSSGSQSLSSSSNNAEFSLRPTDAEPEKFTFADVVAGGVDAIVNSPDGEIPVTVSTPDGPIEQFGIPVLDFPEPATVNVTKSGDQIQTSFGDNSFSGELTVNPDGSVTVSDIQGNRIEFQGTPIGNVTIIPESINFSSDPSGTITVSGSVSVEKSIFGASIPVPAPPLSQQFR